MAVAAVAVSAIAVSAIAVTALPDSTPTARKDPIAA
jgi:hypothetical protein